MRSALGLARRGLGSVWPNPAVGCVLVKDEIVVGRGWTQPGGRPHAETEALARAGAAARGATAFVTLEPCSHFGKTPPCADALIAVGIARVVAALEDPDPRVAGRGLARLREAGVAVERGLCEAEAAELNAGFLQRIRLGRPLVTLKLASSLDGRIATASGESRWITGPAAREQGHLLRAMHDAILVGTETVLADDPELTCRLPGLTGRSPIRIALDRRGRIPLTARLLVTARETPTSIVTPPESGPVQLKRGAGPSPQPSPRGRGEREGPGPKGREGEGPARSLAPGSTPPAVAADPRAALEHAGVTVLTAPLGADGQFDLSDVLSVLGAQGLTRVLVEGGGRLAAALLEAGLVDRLVWFHAPVALGGDGIPAVAPLRFDTLAAAPRFRRIAHGVIGADCVTWFSRGDDAGIQARATAG